MRRLRADAEGERVAAEWLLQGGVAVVPTDTVYGLAARPAEVAAVRAIYRLKGRPEGLHLPVLAASVDQVRSLGVAFTPAAEALARRWWPGPLTLAFGFDAAGGTTRLAAGPHRGGRAYSRARLSACRPAADRRARGDQRQPHGAPTPRTAEDVAGALGSAVDLLVDGGELQDVPSTLVNVSGPDTVHGARRRHCPAGHHRHDAGGPVSRTLLAIETSCDETAAAVVDDALAVRSSVVASQIDLHAAFGGVVPELASRAHLETVTPIVGAGARGGRHLRP